MDCRAAASAEGAATPEPQAQTESADHRSVSASASKPPQGLLTDPSPLLQQLQLFQDQLKDFKMGSPQQPTPPGQGIGPNRPPAAADMSALGAESNEGNTPGQHAESGSADMPSGVSSHDAFRQAMMERLRGQSQQLTQSLSSIGSPASLPHHPQHRQRTASRDLQGIASHSTPKQLMGSHDQLGGASPSLGSTPARPTLQMSLADTPTQTSSPASLALDSIRSALRSVPAAYVASPLASAPASAQPVHPEKGSAVHSAAEHYMPAGLRQSSSRHTSNAAGGSTEESIHVLSGLDSQAASECGQPESSGKVSQRSSGTLPGVERELVRLLGPRFGAWDGPSGISQPGSSAASKAPGSIPGTPGSSRCVLHFWPPLNYPCMRTHAAETRRWCRALL